MDGGGIAVAGTIGWGILYYLYPDIEDVTYSEGRANASITPFYTMSTLA